jgi:ribosomal protein L16 Arg81 hydroxylase
MSKNPVQLKRDNRRKKKFLKHLAMSSHVTQSAKAANIPLSTLYLWRDRDAKFLDDWLNALAAGYELLEMELLHRARNGVEKPVFRNGEKVATVKEYDNGLAFRLLMAHKDMVARTRAARAENTDRATQLRQTLDQKINQMRERLQNREGLSQNIKYGSNSA